MAPDGSLYTVDDLATATQPRRMAKAPAGQKLISAKVSTAVGQDLIVLDRAHRQLHFTTSARDVISHETDDEPVAVLPMRLNSSARQSLVVLRSGHTAPAVTLATTGKVYTVTNTSFDPCAAGSLGAAINAANANPGDDTIVFNIPRNAPCHITDSLAAPR